MKRRDPPRQYLKRTSAEAGNDVVDGAKIQMYGMSMEKKLIQNCHLLYHHSQLQLIKKFEFSWLHFEYRILLFTYTIPKRD